MEGGAYVFFATHKAPTYVGAIEVNSLPAYASRIEARFMKLIIPARVRGRN